MDEDNRYVFSGVGLVEGLAIESLSQLSPYASIGTVLVSVTTGYLIGKVVDKVAQSRQRVGALETFAQTSKRN